VGNGVLNKYLHTENGTPMSAAVLPKVSDQLYGKYVVRFKTDSIRGYRVAWLLWPQSGAFPRDGEIDFPETGLDSTIWGFIHHQGATSGSDQDYVATNVPLAGAWHTTSIEWSPGQVDFFLDGVRVGGTTNRVPSTPMHWVLQTEACYDVACPDPNASSNLQIDCITMYAKN
jgi:beta-glucanase (GH16 family)